MNGNIELLRIFGIPIKVNISWFITLAFITVVLATRVYPELLPPHSRYRDDPFLPWAMALLSGIAFFASIVLHELAHSFVAVKQGIPVKGITLFIFGGVSQITAEARKPWHEFLMAIVGPLTSAVLAGAFFLGFLALGGNERQPAQLVLEWLCVMNVVLCLFNLAPGFPMDGGRVFRAVLWGTTGNFIRSTRWATSLGRALGFGLIVIGALTTFGALHFVDQWSGVWFFVLGFFLETSARQSWLQAQALVSLSELRAEEVMSRNLETVDRRTSLASVRSRGARDGRFIYFVADENDQVLGVVTEKELRPLLAQQTLSTTAEDAMVRAASAPVAALEDDAATMLQSMEAHDVWHLPVVADSRVVGVVSKESLLRILAERFVRRPSVAVAP
jgi:Zn-dependent protease/CBS domain-containing protein